MYILPVDQQSHYAELIQIAFLMKILHKVDQLSPLLEDRFSFC